MQTIPTVEDFQKELSAKENDLKAANDLLATAQNQIADLDSENEALKTEKESFLKNLEAITADNSALVEKLSKATQEIENLKKSEADANAKAVSLLAQVGQPNPVTQEPEPEKNNKQEISKLTGLAKVQAAFKAQSQGKK